LPYTIKQSLYINGMSITLVLILIILILVTFTDICRGEVFSTVVIVHDDTHFYLDREEPDHTTEIPLLPLRDSVEPMGVMAKWNIKPIEKNINGTTFFITIGSKKVYVNPGRRDCQVFFLEQAPVLMNGRTMVPYGFVREVAKATISPELNLKTLANMEGIQTAQNNNSEKIEAAYKYYDLLIGDPCGPSFENAKSYVLEKGLVDSIKMLRYTPIINDTMIVGSDENGREKYVWLGQNMYTGAIYITGTAYTDQGIKQEVIFKKLQSKGIQEKSITTIAIFPYRSGKICWFIEADNGNKILTYFYDFYTGELIEE